MSSKKQNGRKYELKSRAEQQQRTRRTIAQAAAELHERVGPAATTVAEIARRAGVSRLTVYKHFPDNSLLYPACSAHYQSEHPLPDFQAALAPEDPADRLRSVLDAVYGWYRRSHRMMRNLQRDRGTDPALEEFMRGNFDAALASIGDAVTAGFKLGSDPGTRVRTLIPLALDFWTWERLTGEGLGDDEAAALMTDAVAALAGAAATAR